MPHPSCPRCGKEIPDDEIWHNKDFGTEDGDTNKVECVNCEKIFYVSVYETIDFSVSEEET